MAGFGLDRLVFKTKNINHCPAEAVFILFLKTLDASCYILQ